MNLKKKMSIVTLVMAAAVMLTACGGGGGGYSAYSSAYNKVTANGGMDADFDVTLKMDGETTTAKGNFKLDTSGNNQILYYEMDVNGSQITQFSDGEYIYTDAQEHKTKYAIDAKPAASGDKEEAEKKDSASQFNTSEFMNEFSSFLEAGKIKELGLLSPIEKAAVTDISESDGVYTLSFSDSLVKRYLNLMIENETNSSAGETLNIDKLNNFSYKATVSDDIVTGVEYSGTIVVEVPASLMASGEAASYDMDFTIQITFNNPGNKVEVSIPATDGYELVQ